MNFVLQRSMRKFRLLEHIELSDQIHSELLNPTNLFLAKVRGMLEMKDSFLKQISDMDRGLRHIESRCK